MSEILIQKSVAEDLTATDYIFTQQENQLAKAIIDWFLSAKLLTICEAVEIKKSLPVRQTGLCN